MTPTFAPPYTPLDELPAALRDEGHAVLAPESVQRLSGCSADALARLALDWAHLPPDEHLRDGGRYRRRRHASFTVEQGCITPVAARAHWQPVEYNALHGGMRRWFAPMHAETLAAPCWQRLVTALAALADGLRGPQRWYGEAHQFRIDTAGGIGRPTPEGAHRDGVDLVAVFLVARHGIKGGETRIFEAAGPYGQRFTLEAPWSLLLLDDARMIHETTPIQPAGAASESSEGGEGGWRDTLVVTLRAGGFPGDAPGAGGT